MRLEPELWDAIEEICRRENVSIGDIVRRVEGEHDIGGRTSAVRVFVLRYFRAAATEEGHIAAGHGGEMSGNQDPVVSAEAPAFNAV